MAKKSVKSSSFCACEKPCCSCALPALIVGIGIGGLLTYPIFGSHPVKWGISLIAVGLIWCFIQSKKK